MPSIKDVNRKLVEDLISQMVDGDTILVAYHNSFVCRFKYSKMSNEITVLGLRDFITSADLDIPKPVQNYMHFLFIKSKYNKISCEWTNKLSDLYGYQIDNSEFTYMLEKL